MKSSGFIFLLSILSTSICRDAEVTESSAETFHEDLKDYSITAALFYAPWCRHCKKIIPELENAAKTMYYIYPQIGFIKLNCDDEKNAELCTQYNIDAYPKLGVFRKGNNQPYFYKGLRKESNIVEYLKLKVEISKAFNSDFELKSILALTYLTTIVGYFSGESTLKDNFMKTADEWQDRVMFAHTLQDSQPNQIILHRPISLKSSFEEDKIKYSGSEILSDFTKFISDNQHGLVDLRSSHNYEEFKTPYVIAYLNKDIEKTPKMMDYYRSRIAKVSKSYKGLITFAVSKKNEFYQELKEFNITDVNSTNVVVTARNKLDEKFLLEKNFSLQNLFEFVEDFYNHRLHVFVRSETAPLVNNDPVKIAVANNLNETVFNNDTDALLAILVPWCEYCIQLSEIFEEVGREMVGEAVTLAKIDATKNDIPRIFEKNAFPKIYWLPLESKMSPEKYTETRTKEQLIKFIANRSTIPLKKYDRNGNYRIRGEL